MVLTGFIKGEKLSEIMSHAGLFVLPSSHEGLPISLLEAMSYNIDSLVSDIPATHLLTLSSDAYVPVGDVEALSLAIADKCACAEKEVSYDLSEFDWAEIAKETEQILLGK